MVLEKLTFFPIFGIPLIVYGGITTLILVIATIYTGVKQKPIEIHKRLAWSAIIVGAFHGLLALLAYI